MRIGIDARELWGRPTGVGRYLSELLRRWAVLGEAGDHTFVLYTPQAAEPPGGLPADLLRKTPFEIRQIGGEPDSWWEQVRLPSVANVDGLNLFFSPAYSAPLRTRPPFVITIHDLSYMAHPEWFRWREGLRRRWVTRYSARRARVVLTDSEFSKREIVDRLGVAASKVRVIPPGVPAVSGRVMPAPLSSLDHSVEISASGRAARDFEPLVLFVGSLFNRRHIPDLIQAFARVAVKHPDVRLAIVGENRTYPRQDPTALAAAAGIKDRVAVASYVTDEELAELYRKAGVFVFLSEYEGFGLTPLEALAAGVPVVVLDTPFAREVYGEAAVFVRIAGVEDIAQAIESTLMDNEQRAALLREADRVLLRYSWDRAAAGTLAALEAAASSSPS